MTKIFEDFNIYGVPDSDETCILASVFSGEPTLFIGPPGTAKTEIIYMIGSAFRELSKKEFPDDPSKWFEFNVYDTSKLNFEDLIGWPDPRAMKEGRVAFIPSPTTIFDKQLIGLDELNRCAEDRQANLFEVIRNRTCMGAPTRVKMIFSAINPFGDVGTNNLSAAIIDRHSFFIHFGSFDKMDPNLRKKVIERIGSFDSVGIRHWTGNSFKFDTNSGINEELASQGARLREIMQQAATCYSMVSSQLGKSITSLIDTLVSRLSTDKEAKNLPVISGRRAGMIARAIYSYRSVQLGRAKVIGTAPESIKNAAINTILSSIPIGIEKPATQDIITKIKHIVMETVNYWEKTTDVNDTTNANVLYDIYYNPDPIAKLELLLKHSSLDNLVMTKSWKDLSDTDVEVSAILLHLKKAIPQIIPDHAISKEKESEIHEYLASCSKHLSLSSHMEPFQTDISDLMNAKNHKHAVTYICAMLALIKINRSVKSYTEAQVSLKVTNNLIQRCTELIDLRNSHVSTNQPASSDSSANEQTEGNAPI